MFRLIKILSGRTGAAEPQVLPAAAGTYRLGCALILKSGKLQNPTATEQPTHISAQNRTVTEGGTIAACPVSREMIFETRVSASPSALVPGDRLTLSLGSDGCADGVTATTASGVATVYDLCGAAAAGDALAVRFL